MAVSSPAGACSSAPALASASWRAAARVAAYSFCVAAVTSCAAFRAAVCFGVGHASVGPIGAPSPLSRVDAALVDAVEVAAELVVLRLADHVVLVIVAARAAHGEAHECLAHQLCALVDVLDAKLLVDDAAFVVPLAHAQERGGEQLLRGGFRKQIARHLPRDELVVRNVARERGDDPVPVRVHQAAGAIVQVAVAVAVTADIQPHLRHALGVGRCAEQAIDQFFIRIRALVRDERVDFLQRRRQAGEVYRDAIDQCLAVRLR